MRKYKELLFNYLISTYLIIFVSFLFKQYLDISKNNMSDYSDFEYLVRDNFVIIIISLIVFATILLNLFHFLENWVYATKEEIKIKVIVGYRFSELVWEYTSTFMASFILSFLVATVSAIPVLLYLKMSIVYPLLLTFIASFILLSISVLGSLILVLKRNQRNKEIGLKHIKVVSFIFQFSISLLLITMSLMMINDAFIKLSPFKKYSNMTSGWILQGENLSFEKSIEIDANPEQYIGNIPEGIRQIYELYGDAIIVNFTSTLSHEVLGEITYLNQKSLEINGVDVSIFAPYVGSGMQPIILNSSFLGQYKVGDVIHNDPIDLVVVKVQQEGEVISTVAPNDFGASQLSNNNIALFEFQTIDNVLNIRNFNFINTIFFDDLPEYTIQEINESINQPLFKFTYASIAQQQAQYNTEKINTLMGALVVGVCILMFTYIGLVSIIYMDIHIRKVEFSILKLVGYTNRVIYVQYLSLISILFVTAYIISQILSHQTGALTAFIAGIVFVITVLTYLSIALISIRIINRINTVEVIGGENA